MVQIYEQFINEEQKKMGCGFESNHESTVEKRKQWTLRTNKDAEVIYEVKDILCIILAKKENPTESDKIIIIKELIGEQEQ